MTGFIQGGSMAKQQVTVEFVGALPRLMQF